MPLPSLQLVHTDVAANKRSHVGVGELSSTWMYPTTKYLWNSAWNSHKMKGYLVLVLFAAIGIIHGVTIEGRINEDTNWFLSNLSVRPAMTAFIKYNIQYPEGRSQPIITFYYKGQNSSNLQNKCNKNMFGQLYNKHLAVALDRHQCREEDCTTHCFLIICSTTCKTWNCGGYITIQDFEPKPYFFSLGFECKNNRNLKGLKYEVTIYDESNETSCVNLDKWKQVETRRIDRCDISYQYAAIPNQFGDVTLNGAIYRMNNYLGRNPSDFPSKECLDQLDSFLCKVLLPRCLPEENKIILPCRDDCKFYLDGCFNVGGVDFINCDYLPPCEGRNSMSGIISNTTWFLSNLSVRPAMSASLEYHVRYSYDESSDRPIITFYYNGQNSPNLQDKCNSEMHGQLYNKDLAVPLYHRYREKFWCNYKDGGIMDCYGRIKIQDFEPKSYFFSLGFECNDTRGNLNGLKYKVTIFDESNKIRCVDLNLTQGQRIDRCERSYQFAAIPNQIGGTELESAISIMNILLIHVTVNGSLTTYLNNQNKQCMDNLKSLACQIFLPQCLPEENKIILPCRDTCKSVLNQKNCLAVDKYADFGIDVSCDYLPPCPPNYLIIGLSVGACVVVVFMVTVCVKYRKRISDTCLSCLFKQLTWWLTVEDPGLPIRETQTPENCIKIKF